MLVTLLDLETTGLDPTTDEVIEVGAVLYCTSHREIVQQMSSLIPVRKNNAYNVNGIDVMLSDLAQGRLIWPEMAISLMIEGSSYAVAFNSDFDRPWFDREELPAITIPWADAADIRYPKPSPSRSLIALCVAHGIPVVSAHRALDDCRLLAALMGTVPDLDDELIRAARPKVLVKALVGYEGRDLAKAHGFYWDRDVPRAWAKRMPIGDAAELPFDVVKV